jgi:hypothetical protein
LECRTKHQSFGNARLRSFDLRIPFLKEWEHSIEIIRYLFNDRNFEGINFDVVEDNERAKKIYDLVINIGGRKVCIFKKAIVLLDGKKYNRVYYQLFREDLKLKNVKYKKYFNIIKGV